MKSVALELNKQKRNVFVLCILFPIVINALLCISLSARYQGYLLRHQQEYGLTCWQLIFKEQTILYFSELCHVVAAALVYEVFHSEFKDNAWMHIVTSSYRKQVIRGKIVTVAFDLFILLIVNYSMLYLAGTSVDVAEPFPVGLFIKGFLTQYAAVMLYASFAVFLVCLTKKLVLVIPASLAFMVLDILLYYGKGFNYRFNIFFPPVYISHNSISTWSEAVMIIVVSVAASVGLLLTSEHLLSRNCDIRE